MSPPLGHGSQWTSRSLKPSRVAMPATEATARVSTERATSGKILSGGSPGEALARSAGARSAVRGRHERDPRCQRAPDRRARWQSGGRRQPVLAANLSWDPDAVARRRKAARKNEGPVGLAPKRPRDKRASA